jgi:ParB-like chromosome segregation protein Spo0J
MKKPMTLQKIPVADLAGQEKYRLSFNRPIGPLLKSIREAGQSAPVLCRKTRKGFELFSGHLRVEALRELGKKSALAMVWPGAGISGLQALRIAFFENAMTRGLNIIEQAMAVEKLKGLGVGPREIAAGYFQKADLPASVAAIEALLSLNGLEQRWKIFLAQKQIGLRHATQLCRLAAADKKALEILPALGATAGQFREVLDMTDAVSKRDQTGIAEMLSGPELGAVLQKQKLPAPEKLDLLIKHLKKARHPNYHKLNARHQKLLRELNIPGEIKMEPSDYFEGPEYKLELTLTSSMPVQDILEKMFAASRSPDWKKLFELDDED